jgi:hypothetical protein
MNKYHRRPSSFQQLLGIPESAHGSKVRITQGANRIENQTGGLPLVIAHGGGGSEKRDYRKDEVTMPPTNRAFPHIVAK